MLCCSAYVLFIVGHDQNDVNSKACGVVSYSLHIIQTLLYRACPLVTENKINFLVFVTYTDMHGSIQMNAWAGVCGFSALFSYISDVTFDIDIGSDSNMEGKGQTVAERKSLPFFKVRWHHKVRLCGLFTKGRLTVINSSATRLKGLAKPLTTGITQVADNVKIHAGYVWQWMCLVLNTVPACHVVPQ